MNSTSIPIHATQIEQNQNIMPTQEIFNKNIQKILINKFPKNIYRNFSLQKMGKVWFIENIFILHNYGTLI